MDTIIAILAGLFVLHRERLDMVGNTELNIKRDNYLLTLFLFYLIHTAIAYVIVIILKVDNNLIKDNLFLAFNGMFNATIVTSTILIVNEGYKNSFKFEEIPVGLKIITLSLVVKVCACQNFFIYTDNMSEITQFISFFCYVIIWIIFNYSFNKMIKEAIEEKRNINEL